ncbi:MAG: hypothetical protein V2A65_01010 [Candidatus Omnitrophota bacterium]
MGKVMVEIDTKQVESVIEQLDVAEKLKLLKRLERETRRERWTELVSGIRKRYKEGTPIFDEEITRICEEVRQERYERNTKGSN